MSKDDPDFFMLVCVECAKEGRPLPMPFPTPQARGHWASLHTKGTGHQLWRTWEETP